MLRLTKFMRNLVPLSSPRTYVRTSSNTRGWKEEEEEEEEEHVLGRVALEIKRTLSLAHVISGHGRSWGYACIIARL